MYLVISLGIIYILSSFNTKGNASYYRVSQGIAVQDNDKSEVSKGLIEYLSTINGIKNADDYCRLLLHNFRSNIVLGKIAVNIQKPIQLIPVDVIGIFNSEYGIIHIYFFFNHL